MKNPIYNSYYDKRPTLKFKTINYDNYIKNKRTKLLES